MRIHLLGFSVINLINFTFSLGYFCEPHDNPADFFLDVVCGRLTPKLLHNELQVDQKSDVDVISGSKGIPYTIMHAADTYR